MLQTLNTFILACGIVGGDNFGFNGGFETDSGVLFEDLDFPAFPGAVEVDSIFLIAKSHGDYVWGFGVGKGEVDELCLCEDVFDLLGILNQFLASHCFT